MYFYQKMAMNEQEKKCESVLNDVRYGTKKRCTMHEMKKSYGIFTDCRTNECNFRILLLYR